MNQLGLKMSKGGLQIVCWIEKRLFFVKKSFLGDISLEACEIATSNATVLLWTLLPGGCHCQTSPETELLSLTFL